MLRIGLALAVGLVIVIGSGVVTNMARAQTSGDPAAVIVAFEMARNRRDIDAALSYFADDATISQRNTTFSGKDEIRRYLDGATNRARFAVVSDRRASGTHVTWTERSTGAGPLPQPQGATQANAGVNGNAFVVSVEAIVQDGKIRSLAYMAGSQVGRIDPALDGRAQLPASAGLAAVLLVVLGLVVSASVSLRRSAAGASTLRGRMMQDLRGWSAARQVS
jgi:hypothetical protein